MRYFRAENDYILTNIIIESETIEETNDIKFLEIIYDKHPTFKHHVHVIARKMSELVGVLFKLSKKIHYQL